MRDTVTAVRLLADDLTGALDAAVRLRRVAGELPVVFGMRWEEHRGSLALSTNSRDLPAEAAARMLGELFRFWRDDALCFKKIDSLWRGNTVAEIAALARAGRFATIMIASAFPDQQRITRGGRPHARMRREEDWRAIAVDPAAELSALGVRVTIGGPGQLPGALEGVWLLDAETGGDLAAIVRAGKEAAAPVLWCGSAGLAGALAADTADDAAMPLPAPMLAVAGSRHVVTRGQIEDAARRGPAEVIAVSYQAGAWPQAIERAGAALRANRSVILWYSPQIQLSEDTSSRTMSEFFDLLTRAITPPGAVFATGGDTLLRLCRAAQADALLPQWELLPGVPFATLSGGRWDGASLISKSGAFGDADLLAELLGAEAK